LCDHGDLDERGKITTVTGTFVRDLHAYWDNLLDDHTLYFTEPSTSESPSGLALFKFRYSRSKGSNSIFGEDVPTKRAFECMDVGCQSDHSVCGNYGECTERIYDDGEVKVFYHDCSCSRFFGGLFCQFDSADPYVTEQFNAWYNMDRSGNVTYYQEFLYENDTGYFPNEYHNLFWINSIQEYKMENSER